MKGEHDAGVAWPQVIFGDLAIRDHAEPEPTAVGSPSAAGRSALWTRDLFSGRAGHDANRTERLVILRKGLPILEFALRDLPVETPIGRHPSTVIQLEAYRMAMFHACLWRFDDEYYIEALDAECDTLLDRKRLKAKHPVRLRDGTVVDLPGYQLLFTLPGCPAGSDAEPGLEDVGDLPGFFYTPSSVAPPTCPLLSHLVADRTSLALWSEGVSTLKVANIIEETPETKTFCFAGERPLLFSYRPGQFVTLLLDIDGREVQRSYSMSSSPSRPHTLELTVKRVAGGLVSNWLCDHLQLGDLLQVKGPSGKFSCLDNPSRKLMFIAAGSGMTPIMSMCRWIVDTGAEVDVKLLASFRSPPEIIFRKELEWMSARHSAFQIGLTMTAGRQGTECWTGFTGRISPQMLALIAPDYRDRHIFLCGPEPFMDSIRSLLRELDFDFSALHCESFGTGRVAQGPVKSASALTLSGPLHKVTFAKSGLTVDTDEHTMLLDLAEAHGIEIDYSCRSGSCGECEVKCRGEVELSRMCGIDQRSRAAGFVYTCSCAARSDLELDA